MTWRRNRLRPAAARGRAQDVAVSGRTSFGAVIVESGKLFNVAAGVRPVLAPSWTVYAAFITDTAPVGHEFEIVTDFEASAGPRHLLRDGSQARLLVGYRDGGGASRSDQETVSTVTTGEVHQVHFVVRQNGANYELASYFDGALQGAPANVATSNGYTDSTGDLKLLNQVTGSNTDNLRFLAVGWGIGTGMSTAQIAAHYAAAKLGSFEDAALDYLWDASDWSGSGAWTSRVGSLAATPSGAPVKSTLDSPAFA